MNGSGRSFVTENRDQQIAVERWESWESGGGGWGVEEGRFLHRLNLSSSEAEWLNCARCLVERSSAPRTAHLPGHPPPGADWPFGWTRSRAAASSRDARGADSEEVFTGP
ncbi:hypothetical protein SRHO_G00268370 [Serrasalmus rhombeus]